MMIVDLTKDHIIGGYARDKRTGKLQAFYRMVIRWTAFRPFWNSVSDSTFENNRRKLVAGGRVD